MKRQIQRWVEKAQSGDGWAFGKLVAHYQDKVLYLAFDMLGNWDDAKDTAQDAFLKAYQKLPEFLGKSHFSTWLYRITVNLCMDVHRRRKRAPTDLLEESTIDYAAHHPMFSTAAVSPANSIETAETRQEIERALNLLSINQRTAIVLRYFQELSTREISEIMNCNENTVRIHFFRAMEKLKTAMDTKQKVVRKNDDLG